MLRRRRGTGLLETMSVNGNARAAGSSVTNGAAPEQHRNGQIGYLPGQQAEQTRQAQTAQMGHMAAAAPSPAAALSMGEKIAQLQQLAGLKTAGLLTDEEFATQKARILEQ